ncbi:MAG TPA: SDR family oxidoreductase [Acidimicrobiales bacterium]|nr:SDR family oxidoreductase [Acidimicrobiales bacterium]
MDLGLNGRLAVVTGATKGIGRAVAGVLLDEGATVLVHGSRQSTVDDAVRRLEARGDVHGVAGDLADPATPGAIAERVGAFGAPAILVSNAATYWVKPYMDLTDDDWHRSLETNLLAGARLAQLFLPAMLEQDWGRIVFISSDYAIQVNPDMMPYSVAKSAVIALSRGLAVMTRGTGVTVNTVIAGPTWTEGAAAFLDQANPERRDVEEVKREFFEPGGFLSDTLTGRFADPVEVANVVAFMCSEGASAVTGAAQRAEGGTIKSAF